MLLIISDDLSGLDQAIEAIFDKSDHQLCFIHLQRNARRQMSREDTSRFNEKLKEIRIYSRDYEEAKQKFTELLNQYQEKYPSFITYISKKQEKYLSFMKYPKDIRRYIYTTNTAENFISLLERMRIRLGGYFASEEALEVNVMLQCESLSRGRWRKPIAKIKASAYEINQMFRLRFFEKE